MNLREIRGRIMNNRRIPGSKANLALAIACVALSGSAGLLSTHAGAQNPPGAQTAPSNLPLGVQDVVQLTRAGIGEDPILARVRKANISYDLTSDQIIYLRNMGVSENVIAALIGPSDGSPAPAATPIVTTPPLPAAPVAPVNAA